MPGRGGHAAVRRASVLFLTAVEMTVGPSAGKKGEVGALLKALAGDDRDQAVRAAYLLGERFEGRGAGEVDVAAAVAGVLTDLEAVAADAGTGTWLRKRCHRALRKIRSGDGGARAAVDGAGKRTTDQSETPDAAE